MSPLPPRLRGALPRHVSGLARAATIVCTLGFAAAGCRNAARHSEPPREAKAEPALPVLASLPPLSSAPTTLERTYDPARGPAARGDNPSLPLPLADYLARGLGERTVAPGWPAKRHGEKKPGPNRRRLLRFVHLADAQIADDESPARLTSYDRHETITAAMRPHEGYGCRLLSAATRTIRALHERDPLACVVLGGDNVDSAQQNEVGWVLDILHGAPHVECDSGHDDDPVAGPDNDGKDPFASAGLGVSFLWVNGNHDVNVQGNFVVDEAQRALALGSVANGGTRNYAKPGAPAETGSFAVADPRRALLSRTELLGMVQRHADGHGTREATDGRVVYGWTAPDAPVRIVVLDTAHAHGGAAGVLLRSELETRVKPQLDAARAANQIVLLAAHHPARTLTRDGGTFGQPAPDAVLEPEWIAFLAAYPNVVASFVGHSHRHAVRALRTGPRPLWEITTAALVDYPNQFRVVELFDEDNGWLSLHATAVDISTDGDPVAEEGRQRAQIDFGAGWVGDGRGEPDQRNVILWVRKP